MNELFSLADKVYLVTGATSGLGQTVSKQLADNGAIVFLTGRNKEKLNGTLSSLKNSNSHFCFTKNLMDNDYTDLFDYINVQGKKLDGIVHCAGIAPVLPLQFLTRERVEECMVANFYSFIELMRLFSKKKYRKDSASVVVVSSISSIYPDKCQTIYAASKAAINTSVQAMALELVKNGVRINAVVPGSMDTKMSQKAFIEMGDDNRERKLSKQILGLSRTEDVANIVLFLLSDLSKAITGRAIFADGGYINF